MRINGDHTRWAATTITIATLAAGLYVSDAWSRPPGPAGGNTVGLFFGITGTVCMLGAGLLAGRKKVSTWRLGSARLWMTMHIWLGVLAVPFIMFHSGFAWGGPLTTTMMVVFYIVIASGVYGLILQQFVPALMTARLPSETVRGQIDHVISGLAVDAYELVASIVGAIPEAVEERAWLAAEEELQKQRPSNWKQIVRQRPATEPHPLGAELKAIYLAELRPYLRGAKGNPPPNLLQFSIEAAEDRSKLERLQRIAEEVRQLRQQVRLHAWLHNWLFVHAPLSFALFALIAVHIYFALRY